MRPKEARRPKEAKGKKKYSANPIYNYEDLFYFSGLNAIPTLNKFECLSDENQNSLSDSEFVSNVISDDFLCNNVEFRNWLFDDYWKDVNLCPNVPSNYMYSKNKNICSGYFCSFIPMIDKNNSLNIKFKNGHYLKQISNENSRYNLKYMKDIKERCLDTINKHYKNPRINNNNFIQHKHLNISNHTPESNNLVNIDRIGRSRTGQHVNRVPRNQQLQPDFKAEQQFSKDPDQQGTQRNLHTDLGQRGRQSVNNLGSTLHNSNKLTNHSYGPFNNTSDQLTLGQQKSDQSRSGHTRTQVDNHLSVPINNRRLPSKNWETPSLQTQIRPKNLFKKVPNYRVCRTK